MPCRGGAISPEWITDNAQLEVAAHSWGDVIGIDTEFQRTDTFYPIPGLYQVFSADQVFLLDPLTIDDWAPLVERLEDPETVVVMHACSEDLELMKHHLNAEPCALFDTQLAHAFVSTDFSMSYTNLVARHLAIELGKAQTRSNWLRRPLSEAQIQYACEDVLHLPELHRLLRERLIELGRLDWFEQVMLMQGRFQAMDPASYYRNIKRAWRLSGDELAVLKSLAAWRERTAMSEDVPRKRVIWDEHLVSFARQQVLEEAHLEEMLPVPVARRYGEQILKQHRDGRVSEALSRLDGPLSQAQLNVSRQLREVAIAQAQSLDMARELLSRKRDVEGCIRHYLNTGELSASYSGWREELVGEEFRKILECLD